MTSKGKAANHHIKEAGTREYSDFFFFKMSEKFH